MARLEEPAFDREVWTRMLAEARPERATAFPVSEVIIGANVRFVEAAPGLAGFLRAYRSTAADTSAALAAGRAANVSVEQAAKRFLREKPELWRPWLPEDVANRVAGAL